MNWGQKLIIVFILFATGMGYLVYRCMHIDTELVTKEYYKEELRFQDVIDGTKAAYALKGKIQLAQQDQVITVQLPGEMKNKKVTGTIWFYCASDSKKDRHIPIETNSDARQQISKGIFSPGDYTVKFAWMCDDKHYYTEQPFRIP